MLVMPSVPHSSHSCFRDLGSVLLHLQVRVVSVNTPWGVCILNIYYTLILRQSFVVYLKFKFNWAPAFYLAAPLQAQWPLHFSGNTDGISISSDVILSIELIAHSYKDAWILVDMHALMWKQE